MNARVIIAGSRIFDDRQYLFESMDEFQAEHNVADVLCGYAIGADLMGKAWAESKKIPVVDLPANWPAYGKSAGPIRNKLMAELGTHLVAFWDGRSPGTRSMIEFAEHYGLIIDVKYFL